MHKIQLSANLKQLHICQLYTAVFPFETIACPINVSCLYVLMLAHHGVANFHFLDESTAESKLAGACDTAELNLRNAWDGDVAQGWQRNP